MPVLPKVFESPSVDSKLSFNVFAEEIEKLAQISSIELSKRIEDYSELQVALLVRDRAKASRLIDSGRPIGEIREKTLPPCSLALFSEFIREDEKSFALLFERTSITDRITVLAGFLASHQDAYFEKYWQTACLPSKAFVLGGIPHLDPKLIDNLFIKENSKLQKEALSIAMLSNHEILFRRLWQIADPSVRSSKDDPLIFQAIFAKQTSILSFLLQNRASVQAFNGTHTVLELAHEYRNVLGESLVAQIAQHDAGFNQEISICTLFGHAFNLKGEIFEGILPHKTSCVPYFIASFLERQKEIYSRMSGLFSEKPIFSPDVSETVWFSLRSPDELAERTKDKWSLIRCGWKSHAVACIFSKDYCIKINTGASEDAGIHFYRMRGANAENLRQCIRTLIQNFENGVPEVIGAKFFDETLDQNLNLEHIGYLPYRQNGGHCAWYSMKAALLALVMLKHLDKKEISTESLQEAWMDSKLTFSRLWEEKCRMDLASQAIPLLLKHQALFETEAIFNDFIVTCIDADQIGPIRRLLEMVPSYSKWRHPKTGQSLLQLFLEKKRGIDNMSFFHLYELGCDLSIRDNKGRSFYEDFQEMPIELTDYDSMLKDFLASPGVKEWLLKQLEDPKVSRLFTEYRHPDSKKPLAQLALESRKFYLVGLLIFLGYDFSTMTVEESVSTFFSDPAVVEDLRFNVAQYPLTQEKLSHFESFISRMEKGNKE